MNILDAWNLGIEWGRKQPPYDSFYLPPEPLSQFLSDCSQPDLRKLADGISESLGKQSVLRGGSADIRGTFPSDINEALLQISSGSTSIEAGFRTLYKASQRPGQANSAYGKFFRDMSRDLGATLFYWMLGPHQKESIFDQYPFLKEKLTWSMVSEHEESKVNLGFLAAFRQLSERSQMWRDDDIPPAEPYRSNDREFVRILGQVWRDVTGKKPTVTKSDAYPSKFHQLYAFISGYSKGKMIAEFVLERDQALDSAKTFDEGDEAIELNHEKARMFDEFIKDSLKVRLSTATTFNKWLKTSE
jgi:hypothetical protein